MPYAVKNKVARHSPVIFQRNLNKNIPGNLGGVMNQASRIFDVLQNVTEYCQVKLFPGKRELISIE